MLAGDVVEGEAMLWEITESHHLKFSLSDSNCYRHEVHASGIITALAAAIQYHLKGVLLGNFP